MNDKNKRIENGLTIKIPVEEVEMTLRDLILNHLKENQSSAFTRAGLMVELFDYNPKDLNQPFSDWPKGAPSLYNKISTLLEEVVEEGIIIRRKKGKSFLYWWKK